MVLFAGFFLSNKRSYTTYLYGSGQPYPFVSTFVGKKLASPYVYPVSPYVYLLWLQWLQWGVTFSQVVWLIGC